MIWTYKAELELLDRYLQFASELLRLALLAIALIGFAYDKNVLGLRSTGSGSKRTVALAVVFFVASAALSVAYRYFTTEAFRSYSRGLRLHISDQETSSSAQETSSSSATELEKRDRLLRWCIRFKASAAIALVLGTLFLGLAIVGLLL